MNIIRTYPNKIKEECYPFRYKNDIFDKYNNLIKNEIILNNYEKWKTGINYKTNRKITINGKIHKKLKNIFMIGYNNKEILFEELKNIDITNYNLETKKIYTDIDNKNKIIQEYNKKIDIIINNINLLTEWDDYIEFENNKYGIPIIYNFIHRENNCFGLIIKDKYESCRCNTCENWHSCGNGGTQYYKCDKCNICELDLNI